MKKKVLLIDAFAVIHRAFHALPDFKDPEGRHVNVVYGFFSTLLKAVRDIKPDYLVVAFDLVAPTFRHKIFEEYKAQRPEAPPAMAEQIPLVKELIQILGLPVAAAKGYEAEDVIATIIKKTEEEDLEHTIVTGDRDTLQLARSNVKIYFLRKGLADVSLVDDRGVRQLYGVSPQQIIDIKALAGDASDNLPGLAGIGAKTAVELVKEYGGLEGIFANLLKLPPRLQRLLKGKKKAAFLSQKLVTVKEDAPFDFSLSDFRFDESLLKNAIPFLEKLGMTSLVRRLNASLETEASPQQQTLL